MLAVALVVAFSNRVEPRLLGSVAQAQAIRASANPYPRRVPAPPLDGAQWVNTPVPLSLADFRGRFVLLDFWTFCCINCMHELPELKKLEHAFPTELVVIGIHSAKFAGERVSDNIRQAALRYEIEHPIVNDANLAIWTRYGVQSWPTLVLIDPTGDVVWASSGERRAEDIKAVINRGLPFYRAHRLLRPGPRPTIIGAAQQQATPLKYPGKVLADADGGRLFVADSNHNRIVVANFAGQLQQVIGSGATGRADGDFKACSFNHPQGMALVGNMLYVADTENHLLRKVDLSTRRVTTIAGTGKLGNAAQEIVRPAVGSPANPRLRTTPLSSPWALCPLGKDLFIAMAGMHQIWKMRLDESVIGPYAGNGQENITDGRLLPHRPYDPGFSSFAQPSGISSDGTRLFVADSEGSTVRAVTLAPNGKVETLVGLTGTLFDFGDKDGAGAEVRLQHPLGVAWWDGKLYVADTYNNKIKVIDVEQRTCRTVAGTGQPGKSDAENGAAATFSEPGGISAAAGKLFVADTNNHAIRVVELAAPFRVTTLPIQDLAAPSSSK